MKSLYSRLLIIAVLAATFGCTNLRAQIFEPEGINMPGTWNNFTNPPADGSVFGSSTQVNGGVTPVNLGQKFWQTTVHIAESGGDTTAGTYTWLFTSGPSGNPYANKWAGVNVLPNTIQDYQYNTGSDNSIDLANDMYYTFNWEDVGYQASRAIVMVTSGAPVGFLSQSFLPVAPTSAEGVMITAELINAPATEELFYVRYSIDEFQTSEIVLCTVNGSQIMAEIPAQPNGSTVQYYLFSSTIADPQADFDLITLKYLNNAGENFSYTVQDETLEVNLGNDTTICQGQNNITLSAGAGYDSYLWSTGDETADIIVDSEGQYWVEVSLGDLTARDTILVSVSVLQPINLGSDTTICSNSSFVLSTGLSVSAAGDSLTIRYDATQGVSGLQGAPKVYMHSGVAFTAQGEWNNVVGNWGQDDGVGEMQPDGILPNVWKITINPYSYYGIPEGSDFSGIWMVFRNADGSATGKNETNQDIYIHAEAYPSLASAFGGVTASVQPGTAGTIIWSTGETSSSIEVTESGLYWAELSQGNCSLRDSIQITMIDVPQLNVSSDTSFCAELVPFEISASAGFDTYEWSTGETNSAITVSDAGVYVVNVTIGPCSLSDSVTVQNNISAGLANLGTDVAICGNEPLTLNPGVSISPYGDQLTIVYDATQGQSGLSGAASVYMHSTFEYQPFGGPVEPWIGNWGQDDGLGEMTQIGENLWSITISVYDYYNVNPDSIVAGLFMVFRNADGSAEGKDENGNDIYLNLQGAQPVSAFGGVTASIEASPFGSMLWSTGAVTPQITVNTPGIYSVTLFGSNGCNAADTIVVSAAPVPTVNLGSNQVLCDGASTTLDAGPGFSSYLWSTGETTQTLNVTTGGNYTVTVTNAEGCQAVDNIGISAQITPDAAFTWLETGGLDVMFTYTGTGTGQFFWDFDNDGNVDNTNAGSANFSYPDTGIYTASLVVSNTCGVDTTSVQINLIGLHNTNVDKSHFRLYPNPTTDKLIIESEIQFDKILIMDLMGRILLETNNAAKITIIDLKSLSKGVYILQAINGTQHFPAQRFVKN